MNTSRTSRTSESGRQSQSGESSSSGSRSGEDRANEKSGVDRRPDGIEVISGSLQANGLRFALVAARFNERVVTSLIDGAIDCLRRHGAATKDIRLVRVPGAWEIPAALDALAGSEDRPDALVALGVVIRGETPHFDYVCSQCAAGVTRVGERHQIAVGMGVLTCDTPPQAQERAGGKAGNKGWEAAEAALEMANLLRVLRRPAGE